MTFKGEISTKKEKNGETYHISRKKVVQLNEELIDPNSNSEYYEDITYMPIDGLVNDLLEQFWDPSLGVINFENGRVKLDIFRERNYQIDKYIKIDQSGVAQNINGVILDLETNQDFAEAYNRGIECGMPKCMEYYERVNDNPDDWEDIADEYDEDELKGEIEGAIEATLFKASAGAEIIPKGLYFIKDNKIYYITLEELYEIYPTDLNSEPGPCQMTSSLIEDNNQATSIIECLGSKTYYFVEKKSIDLDYLASMGISAEDITEKLLNGDEEVFKLLSAELKNNILAKTI